MLLLFLYFIYLWTVFFVAGFGLNQYLFAKNASGSELILSGIAISLFFFSSIAFLFPLSETVSVLYHFCVIMVFILNRKMIIVKHRDIILSMLQISLFQKICFAWLFGIVLIVSAMPPFLIDNETYYIQSIQWLNQFGYTKGLANIHPFLGQMSAWHVLEAGLNIQWNGITTNDLNGFLFLVVIGSAMKSSFNKAGLSTLLLIIAPGLLFFISSPSPDLPILLFVSYLVVIILNRNQSNYYDRSVWIALVLAMLFLIKVTIFPLFGILFLLNYNNKNGYKMAVIGSITGLIWIFKNYFISGWMLYPFPWWQAREVWTLPSEFYRFEASVHQLSFIQNVGFSFWMLLAIGLSISVWVFLRAKSNIKNTWMSLATIQIVVVLASNASIRLALPGIMIWILVVGSLLCFEKHKLKLKFVPMLACIAGLCVFGLLNFKTFIVNKTGMYHGGKSFSYKQMVVPASNTRFESMIFEKCKEGNLEYYSPKQKMLLFNTFAGSLPTLNQKQLKYFKNRFHIVPQKIGNDLKDGFYSKKLSE